MTQVTIQDNSVSFVWTSRLNTTLCNFWRVAPEMTVTALCLKEKPEWDFNRANEAAQAVAVVPELPTCRVSDNEDGRTNVSWYCDNIYGLPHQDASCMYTVDAEGMAVCKEYPDEHLDLSDYGWLLGVAATIYCDLSVSDIESDGLRALLQLWQEEPEWVGDHALPT